MKKLLMLLVIGVVLSMSEVGQCGILVVYNVENARGWVFSLNQAAELYG